MLTSLTFFYGTKGKGLMQKNWSLILSRFTIVYIHFQTQHTLEMLWHSCRWSNPNAAPTSLLFGRLAFPESNLLFEFFHVLLNFLFHTLTLFHFPTHSLKSRQTGKNIVPKRKKKTKSHLGWKQCAYASPTSYPSSSSPALYLAVHCRLGILLGYPSWHHLCQRIRPWKRYLPIGISITSLKT